MAVDKQGLQLGAEERLGGMFGPVKREALTYYISLGSHGGQRRHVGFNVTVGRGGDGTGDGVRLGPRPLLLALTRPWVDQQSERG